MPKLIELEDLYSGLSTVKALPAVMETVAGRFYELIEKSKGSVSYRGGRRSSQRCVSMKMAAVPSCPR